MESRDRHYRRDSYIEGNVVRQRESVPGRSVQPAEKTREQLHQERMRKNARSFMLRLITMLNYGIWIVVWRHIIKRLRIGDIGMRGENPLIALDGRIFIF